MSDDEVIYTRPSRRRIIFDEEDEEKMDGEEVEQYFQSDEEDEKKYGEEDEYDEDFENFKKIKKLYEYIDDDDNQGLTKYITDLDSDYEDVFVILNSRNSPEDHELEELTPLEHAIIYSTPEIVDTLIHFGADVDGEYVDGWKRPPLFVAIEQNDINMVRALLKAGASVFKKMPDTNYTAIDYANQKQYSDPEVSMAIFLSLPTLEAYNHALRGHKLGLFLSRLSTNDILSFLPRKVDIVHALLDSGHTTKARELLENGSFGNMCDAQGKTVLMQAVERGYIEVIHFLVAARVPVNSTNADGTTALMVAAQRGRTDVVRVLLAAGARVNTIKFAADMALTHAVNQNHIGVVRVLLEFGARVNAININGSMIESNETPTPLMMAAQMGYLEMVYVLLEAGAPVNATDANGTTALMYAVEGAPVNATDANGYAVAYNRLQVARVLLKKGANVKAKANHGITAIRMAVDRRDADMMRVLLDYESDKVSLLHFVYLMRDPVGYYFTQMASIILAKMSIAELKRALQDPNLVEIQWMIRNRARKLLRVRDFVSRIHDNKFRRREGLTDVMQDHLTDFLTDADVVRLVQARNLPSSGAPSSGAPSSGAPSSGAGAPSSGAPSSGS